MKDSKTVLLISHDYPPQGWTSSRRSGNMAKYLSDYGWQPVVLCQKWTPDNCVYDPTIVMNIPEEVKVYAAEIRSYKRLSIRYLDNMIHRIFLPHLSTISFYKSARKLLPAIFKNHRIDAIWGSAPMPCNHSLAAYAAKRYEIPWVADFRDVNQFINPGLIRFHRQLRIFFEKQVMKSASAITAVSEGFAATLTKRHQREVEIIPNGYDPDILAPMDAAQITKFNILYTGGVNLGTPNFRSLLDACGLLIEKGQINRQDITIQFYGANNTERLQKMFENHKFLDLVEMHGQIHRVHCIELQRKAAVLLQATYPGTGTLTSKIYEYMAARRPILGIPKDDNGIDELLSRTNAGKSCSSVEEIADQLLNWYHEWKNTGTVKFHGRLEEIRKYSRKEQAGKLASILDQLNDN